MIRSPPDFVEDYKQDYGYLGPALCAAVAKARTQPTALATTATTTALTANQQQTTINTGKTIMQTGKSAHEVVESIDKFKINLIR